MKKSVIALAVSAAMPIAAQADVTISGSVSTSLENSSTAAKTLDIDSKLKLESTEVLTNGMTATASLGLLADSDDDTDNAGKVSLAGDFGTLTVANDLDRDGVFQFGNVGAGNQTGLYETSDSASTSNAVHYAGGMAGLSVEAQINASTAADETTAQSSAVQVGAQYEYNGLTVGFANVDSDMTTDNGTSGKTIKKGSTVGATYNVGDLTIGYGKDSNADDPVMSAAYATTIGDIGLSGKFVDTGASDYTIASASYNMDALTVALDYSTLKGNSGSKMISTGTKTTKLTGTYVAGNMTTTLGTQWDGAVDLSVAVDMGNADVSVKREGKGDAADSVTKTSLKYSVAF